jgi:hypothetical protein
MSSGEKYERKGKTKKTEDKRECKLQQNGQINAKCDKLNVKPCRSERKTSLTM